MMAKQKYPMVLAACLLCASAASLQSPRAAVAEPPPGTAKDGAPTCELLTHEAPAGGRLEVRVTHAGKSPLVKIAGKVARLIQRQGDTIAVQIHKRCEGGRVTLHADNKSADCGTLTIIGQN